MADGQRVKGGKVLSGVDKAFTVYTLRDFLTYRVIFYIYDLLT